METNGFDKNIPNKLNIVLVSFVILLNLFQLIILPIWLLPASPWWGLTVIIAASFALFHWALLHEAIHKILNSNSKANDFLGRVLSILLFISFNAVRFGHLMHHRFNRKLDSEWYDAEKTSPVKTNIKYYFTLFFGLYLTELVASVMLSILPKKLLEKFFHYNAKDYEGKFMPEMEQAANNYFFRRDRIKDIRVDCFLSAILFITSLFLFGAYWPVFLAIFFIRGIIISFHDNVYHYGTDLDNSKPAKELYMPKFLSKIFMLNFNQHMSHHKSTSTSWKDLPKIHREKNIKYDDDFIRAFFMQMQGPLRKNNI